jgi:Putative regulator of cell autolysis
MEMDNTFVIIYVILSAGALLLLSFTAVYFYKAARRAKTEKQRFEQLCGELTKKIERTELPSIEAKLNPHLFKNILNSIQSHAYQTYYAMDKLANVLDYILYESNGSFVTPQEEIEFALNLIEINKIKVSPLFALNVKNKTDESDPLYRTKVMAPLISVDLIENAFKHADLQNGDAFIAVSFEFRHGIFSLTVANKISSRTALHKEKSGIGSATLEQRLQILYNGHYRLDREVENNTYTAHLTIDLNEKATEVSAAR